MSRTLLLRILSAAILIPIAIAAAWAGGAWFAVVVGLFALGMAWEWGVRSAGLPACAGAAIGDDRQRPWRRRGLAGDGRRLPAWVRPSSPWSPSGPPSARPGWPRPEPSTSRSPS
jgi:hypothetical protein